FASLFTDRAIRYRADMGFEDMEVALSIGVQQMVRSDLGSAGVIFTIDPETGLDTVMIVTGAWGLGENVVRGNVDPDEFILFKPNLKSGRRAVIDRKLGRKQMKMVYSEDTNHMPGVNTVNLPASPEEQECYILTPADVTQLGLWCLQIE